MNRETTLREGLDEMSREADRIVNLILHTTMPRVDIEIQIENLREECEKRYPGSGPLFDMVYGSRFQRIWDQWSGERPTEEETWESAWDE